MQETKLLRPIQTEKTLLIGLAFRVLKREDKRQMTTQYGHGFLSIFFGGKYDLIQLHRQIIHQNAQNFFFTTKITSPPALLVKNLKKTMKMTRL